MAEPKNPNNNRTPPAATDPHGINRNTIPGHKLKSPNNIAQIFLNNKRNVKTKSTLAKNIKDNKLLFNRFMAYISLTLDNLSQQKILSFFPENSQKGGSRKCRNKTRKQ